jgi:penicillin-binding protein 2
VAAVDPRDGSILGLYSSPAFNPNAWSGRLSTQEKQEIDENPYHPLLDKAVYAWAPGSTYKIVGAIAALEEGVFDPDTTVKCRGRIEYGGRVFRCWKRSGHGWMKLEEAIENSCDVYFYELGIRLGMDTLADYAYQLGFGQRAGIGVPGERSGLVPTREWHEQNTEGGFVGGFTLGAAIGQDVVQVTPVQLALSYAAIANGGTLYYPRLIDEISTAEGRVVFEYPTRVRNELPFAEATMEHVRNGLESVVETGSGSASQLEYVDAAGKTGTAQVASLDSLRVGDDGVLWKYRDHAWFATYAPAEDPRIAVVVFVEHGGQGSQVAAPIAMNIVDRYFREVMGWNEEIQVSTNSDRKDFQAVLNQPRAIDIGGRSALEMSLTDILSLGQDGLREQVQ